jgi:hypothetical protein
MLRMACSTQREYIRANPNPARKEAETAPVMERTDTTDRPHNKGLDRRAVTP